MHNRIKTKSRLILMILVFTFCCGLTACQPTPGQDIIANKGESDLVGDVEKQTQQGVEQETGKKLKDKAFPERYTYSEVSKDGSVTVHVDAAITLPETGKLPFARVAPQAFTQEMVTGMFKHIFPHPDDRPLGSDYVQSKAEIEEHILYLKQDLIEAEKFEDDGAYKRQIEERIKLYEKKHAEAPDEPIGPTETDGTLKLIEPEPMSYAQYPHFRLEASTPERFLLILTGFNSKEPYGGGQLWMVDHGITKSSTFTTDGAVLIEPGEALPEAAQGKLTLKLEEAIALADAFFAAGKIEDIALFAAYVVDNHGTGQVDNNRDPASEWAYRLFYTRTVNGTPVACHSSRGASSEEEYDISWFYESIEVTVLNEGISEINWLEPCETTELLSEDTDIIDFEQAIALFQSNIFFTYSSIANNNPDTTQTIDIEIDEIRLCPMRLKEKNRPGERAGVYVPCYVFYGTAKQKTVYHKENYTHEVYTFGGSGNDFYPGPVIAFAINAVDGTVVNILGSY